MLDDAWVKRFAEEWVEAWNAHDLDRVLALYAEDFEMVSPLIVTIAGEPSGRLKGKPAVRAYWEKGLRLLPDLHFELRSILVGVEGMTLTYRGHRGLVAEVFQVGPDRQVTKVSAHYALQA
ncbi:MAG: nuclear transport factor 2 family protein [Nitrospira sp.]